ncbi:MAG: hypothetical protein KDB14_17040 [Planctomycetales bacterium]|nr:hypothetical protein [Planctomycetales bacterium]
MNGDRRKGQFSLRQVAALTAAAAVWVWHFREAEPAAIATFSFAAVTAGIIGHFVDKYWNLYALSALVAVLLVYNGALLALALFEGAADPLGALIQVLVAPAEMLKWQLDSIATNRVTSNRDTVFLLVMLLGTLLFTPAHWIRPSLPTAIITALGVGLWYGTSILILSHAG